MLIESDSQQTTPPIPFEFRGGYEPLPPKAGALEALSSRNLFEYGPLNPSTEYVAPPTSPALGK